jgi:hypothetical protein
MSSAGAHPSRSPKSWPAKRPPSRSDETTRSHTDAKSAGGQNGSDQLALTRSTVGQVASA